MWQPFHSCWNVKIKFGGLFTVVRRSKQSVATFSQLLEGRNKLRQFLNEYKVLENIKKKTDYTIPRITYTRYCNPFIN